MESPSFKTKLLMAGLSVGLGVVIYLVSSYFSGWAKLEAQKKMTEERERALREERARIGQSLHGTLGAALSEISLWHEIALAGAAQDAEPLSRAQARAKSALTDLRALVAGFDDESIPAANLCAGVRRQIEGLCTAANIRLEFTEPPEGSQDMASAYHIAKIIVEGVTNAVKHAKPTFIRIELELAPLRLTVHDDGCGFDPANGTRGRGLRSLHEHADALRARLTLESAPGRGTRIHIEKAPA